MTTIRETENYKLIQDVNGCTRICDKLTGCLSNWNVGVEVRDEINHIKHLTDTDFDEYCKEVICNS